MDTGRSGPDGYTGCAVLPGFLWLPAWHPRHAELDIADSLRRMDEFPPAMSPPRYSRPAGPRSRPRQMPAAPEECLQSPTPRCPCEYWPEFHNGYVVFGWPAASRLSGLCVLRCASCLFRGE